ncbi:MAG TPA: hypothetical protein VHC22_13560 [Pirellulales bacterium]|nr:hypothetical protein [Pirellulales bacterium]
MRNRWKIVLGLLAIGGWPYGAQGADQAEVAFEDEAVAASVQTADARSASSRRQAPVARTQQASPMGGPMASDGFNSWFNAYRGFQSSRGRLRTAEGGGVEMATGEITTETAETPGAEDFVGGIPSSQARGRRPGMGRAMSSGGAWFNAGSPFGIKYGYGSGYGYGGYGFDNPYGYGSRSGSGGAYSYGFGPFGSVGGQTGERLSSLISSGAGVEPGRLISPEPGSIGAPGQIERGAVGGTFGRAGAGSRPLGGSAAEGSE